MVLQCILSVLANVISSDAVWLPLIVADFVLQLIVVFAFVVFDTPVVIFAVEDIVGIIDVRGGKDGCVVIVVGRIVVDPSVIVSEATVVSVTSVDIFVVSFMDVVLIVFVANDVDDIFIVVDSLFALDVIDFIVVIFTSVQLTSSYLNLISFFSWIMCITVRINIVLSIFIKLVSTEK